MEKLKQFFEFASTNGLWLLSAFDKDKPGPSASLLFAHAANAVALGAIITLIIKDTLQGTIAAMMYSVLMIVFYLMRRLTKFKADLDDKSIEIEGEDNDKKNS
jgi:hypothetical protein